MKRTVIIGASSKPERYAYQAVEALDGYGHEVFPIGIKEGVVNGIEIITDQPIISFVDTITIYLSAERQPPMYDYIFQLKPKRIIFNPGAENPELEKMAREKNILTENACTLVLIRTKQY